MLDTLELADLRADMEATFPQTVTRSRPGARVSDGKGGFTTGTPTTETYAGRLIPPMSGIEAERSGRTAEVTKWRMALPWDADVKQTDTLSTEGSTWQVLSTNRGQLERAELLAILERVV